MEGEGLVCGVGRDVSLLPSWLSWCCIVFCGISGHVVVFAFQCAKVIFFFLPQWTFVCVFPDFRLYVCVCVCVCVWGCLSNLIAPRPIRGTSAKHQIRP